MLFLYVDFYLSPIYVREEFLEIAGELCNRESVGVTIIIMSTVVTMES